MWKHRIWYLALFVTTLIVYVIADKRESLVLLGILVILPFSGACLEAAAMQGLTVSCSVQGMCRAGQEVAVKFACQRKNRLPLGSVRLRLVFENVLYGEKTETELRLVPDEKREMSFVYRMKTEDCGNVKIYADTAVCQDLLGLAAFKRSVDIQREILVYPPALQLHADLRQRPLTKSFGEMYDQQKKGQDTSEVADLRDYIPGDAMNSIHWKLSGKMDNLIVREFGAPSDYSTLILYEMMKKSGDREIPKDCNNAVLALTASLSRSMLELGLEHNVGRIFHREFQTVPVYSTDTCEQMQMNLLCMPIAEDANGADTVYGFLRGNLRSEYTKLIYITPCYEDSTVRQLAREAGLTVIEIVRGKGTNFTASAGYSVISVDVETYQEKVHAIEI